MSDSQDELPVSGSKAPNWHDLVSQQVGSLRYGLVEIVVHDGRVTQIEKTEKMRLEKVPDKYRPDQTR